MADLNGFLGVSPARWMKSIRCVVRGVTHELSRSSSEESEPLDALVRFDSEISHEMRPPTRIWGMRGDIVFFVHPEAAAAAPDEAGNPIIGRIDFYDENQERSRPGFFDARILCGKAFFSEVHGLSKSFLHRDSSHSSLDFRFHIDLGVSDTLGEFTTSWSLPESGKQHFWLNTVSLLSSARHTRDDDS